MNVWKKYHKIIVTTMLGIYFIVMISLFEYPVTSLLVVTFCMYQFYLLYKQISSEYLYDGWIKIKKVEYKGKIFEKLINYDSVTGLVINKDEKILLVKQYRPALGKHTLEFVAGCMDKNKTESETLIEELQEEANIQKDKILSINKIRQYNSMPGLSSAKSNLFIVMVDVPAINKTINDDDVEEIIWVTYKELEELIDSGKILNNSVQRGYEILKTQKLLQQINQNKDYK